MIIIDEMDSVGVKHPGSGGSSQEVNAILTMIDEIKSQELNIFLSDKNREREREREREL